jgi:hypothetical protein
VKTVLLGRDLAGANGVLHTGGGSHGVFTTCGTKLAARFFLH